MHVLDANKGLSGDAFDDAGSRLINLPSTPPSPDHPKLDNRVLLHSQEDHPSLDTFLQSQEIIDLEGGKNALMLGGTANSPFSITSTCDTDEAHASDKDTIIELTSMAKATSDTNDAKNSTPKTAFHSPDPSASPQPHYSDNNSGHEAEFNDAQPMNDIGWSNTALSEPLLEEPLSKSGFGDSDYDLSSELDEIGAEIVDHFEARITSPSDSLVLRNNTRKMLKHAASAGNAEKEQEILSGPQNPSTATHDASAEPSVIFQKDPFASSTVEFTCRKHTSSLFPQQSTVTFCPPFWISADIKGVERRENSVEEIGLKYGKADFFAARAANKLTLNKLTHWSQILNEECDGQEELDLVQTTRQVVHDELNDSNTSLNRLFCTSSSSVLDVNISQPSELDQDTLENIQSAASPGHFPVPHKDVKSPFVAEDLEPVIAKRRGHLKLTRKATSDQMHGSSPSYDEGNFSVTTKRPACQEDIFNSTMSSHSLFLSEAHDISRNPKRKADEISSNTDPIGPEWRLTEPITLPPCHQSLKTTAFGHDQVPVPQPLSTKLSHISSQPSTISESDLTRSNKRRRVERSKFGRLAERLSFAALGGVTVGILVFGSLVYTAPTF